ncbi:MAG: MATE family efflux transporter [Oscillospiraceae bacterium]
MLSFLHRGRGFYRGMALLAIPIILQNLITESLGLVDTFMVGMLGEAELAAVTVANIPIFVILLLIFGIQSGSSVLISQHWGKRDTDTINRVIGIGIYVALTISVLFAAVMFFFPVQFMGLFTNDANLAAIAASYGKIVGISYIFNSVTQVYIGAHRSMAHPRLGLYILSVSMCSNTFLNWVLIFGNLGAPKMGVVGAATATLISRILEFVVMVCYASFNRRFKLKPKLLLRPGTALFRQFVRYSTPVVVNETLWGLGTSIYPTIMGHMAGSQEILAAFAISGNIEKVCTVAVFAVAGTAAIIVGREIGAGRADTVYDVGLALNTVAFGTGLVVGILMIGVTFFFIQPVVYPLFGLSQGAREIATMMLLVTFLTLSVRSFNSTNIVGVLRGGGDVRVASLIDLSPLWFVALPLAALAGLVFHMGIFWVYLAITMENVVKFFLGVSRLRSGAWIHDVTQMSFKKGEKPE